MSAPSVFEMAVRFQRAGRLADAAALLERALGTAPENALYLSQLGDVYRCLGRRSEAVAVLLMALARKPEFAGAAYHLALAFDELGDWAAAAVCCERACALEPGSSELAECLARLKVKAAEAPAGAGVTQAGLSAPEALAALAETLRLGGRADGARAWYGAALQLDPRMPSAHAALGAIHADAGRFDEAIAAFRQALELDPSFHDARSYLAAALGESGQLEAAQGEYREAVRLRPDDADAHSALIFNLQFWPGVSAQTILDEARLWNLRHARPLAEKAAPPENDRAPERRLRIGYVSPDFRTHVAALFIVPLLKNHDHERFEVFCYASVSQPDRLTERFRGYADVFREVSALDDAALSEVIRRDRIDILVDMTMHMTDRRLLAFARRPAPVQLCWLAYPGTTGLETLDYRVSDPFLDPPGADTTVYSEATLRLPDSFWCYDPLADGPEVSPLPALANGRITFGCLNHFRKVNEGVLRAFAGVLAAVPASRLLLMAPAGSARERVRAAFARVGVELGRLEFVERAGRLEYLRRYAEIDVCLDTFPYNGHTTSLDALWMGVPTVTLAGETVVGRAGVCQAMNLGLPELIATTEEQYVRVASSLAADLERLSELRRTLRERMRQSPLMDGPRFARNLESAYRDVWRRFCAPAK